MIALNYIYNKVRKAKLIPLSSSLILIASSFAVSCSDWNDHYDGEGSTASSASIWDQIQSNPQLSDFAEVMQAISVTRQHRKTTTPYAELLQGGRTLTVFAPVNGTFNKDSIISLVQTNSGDSAVEKSFAQNHLVSDVCSFVGDGGGLKKKLLNDRYVTFADGYANGIGLVEKNISCKNGVLHVLNKPLPYSFTIYEALTNLADFYQADNDISAGKILRSYNVQEFNESASTPNGTVEGVTVYVDSVTYDKNRILDSLECKIDATDSTYIVAIPSQKGWQAAWDKAYKAYNYSATTDDRDSIQKSNTFRALLADAIYSMTTVNKNQTDSICSVKYNSAKSDFDPRYHVFYDPYKANGVLYQPENIVECCNGKIYEMSNWSLDPSKTYHSFIEVEGETYKAHNKPSVVTTSNQITPSPYTYKVKVLPESIEYLPEEGTSVGDSISKGNFVKFMSSNGTKNWNVTYKLTNTLSAKYDVKVVVLPVNVIPTSDLPKPVVFKAALNYIDADGNEQHEIVSDNFTSDPYRIDTITVFKDFTFPACNYGMVNNSVSLTIESAYDSKKTKGCTSTMYLDDIILTPKED